MQKFHLGVFLQKVCFMNKNNLKAIGNADIWNLWVSG